LQPLAQPQARTDNVAIGMLWYGVSSFFFAAMGICTKLLGQYHYPVWEITLFRAIIILGCCLSVLVSAGAFMPMCHVVNRRSMQCPRKRDHARVDKS
jgi:drug/metabolite transporter (DMT)-like permease